MADLEFKDVTGEPRSDEEIREALRGPMYLVCAQWDLTDIERAVLFSSTMLD